LAVLGAYCLLPSGLFSRLKQYRTPVLLRLRRSLCSSGGYTLPWLRYSYKAYCCRQRAPARTPLTRRPHSWPSRSVAGGSSCGIPQQSCMFHGLSRHLDSTVVKARRSRGSRWSSGTARPAAGTAVELLYCQTVMMAPAGVLALNGGDTVRAASTSPPGESIRVSTLASNPFFVCWANGGAHRTAGVLAAVTLVVYVFALPLLTLQWVLVSRRVSKGRRSGEGRALLLRVFPRLLLNRDVGGPVGRGYKGCLWPLSSQQVVSPSAVVRQRSGIMTDRSESTPAATVNNPLRRVLNDLDGQNEIHVVGASPAKGAALTSSAEAPTDTDAFTTCVRFPAWRLVH